MYINTILMGILAICLIVSIIWQMRTEKRLHKLLRGKSAESLEDTFATLAAEVDNLKSLQREVITHMKVVDAKLSRSVRNIETIRFNPFHESGSNQSFSTAMVNDAGDGVVISSLYSRERVSVFAKPVKDGKAEYELTGEEEQVLSKALGK